MKSGIPLDKLIETQSKELRNTFSNSKLHTLLIQKYNEEKPLDRWAQFLNANEAKTKLDLKGRDFADLYFNVVSKNLTKPELLNVFTWNDKATPSILVGGRLIDLLDLKKVNGNFSITIGNIKKEVSLDLSGANSFNDVAIKVEEAIKATAPSSGKAKSDFENVSVNYDIETMGLLIKTGEKGVNSNISFIEAPSSGTDISNSLSLKQNQGAYIIKGLEAVNSILNVLEEIEEKNGPYYVITTNFNFENELNLLENIGKWIKKANGRFLFIYGMNNNQLLENRGYLEGLKAYDGLVIEFMLNSNQNAFIAGLISALDFSIENGNYNFDYNKVSIFENTITTTKQMEALDSNRVNSIYTYGRMGQFATWWGRGNIMGELTKSLNIFVCNSYLLNALQFAISNMFLENKFVGLRGENNEALIISYLVPVFNQSIRAGIIIQGVKLEENEKNSVVAAFNTLGDDAIFQLETNGYFFNISKIDLSNNSIDIIISYVANTPIKKIIIKNYIIGA